MYLFHLACSALTQGTESWYYFGGSPMPRAVQALRPLPSWTCTEMHSFSINRFSTHKYKPHNTYTRVHTNCDMFLLCSSLQNFPSLSISTKYDLLYLFQLPLYLLSGDPFTSPPSYMYYIKCTCIACISPL